MPITLTTWQLQPLKKICFTVLNKVNSRDTSIHRPNKLDPPRWWHIGRWHIFQWKDIRIDSEFSIIFISTSSPHHVTGTVTRAPSATAPPSTSARCAQSLDDPFSIPSRRGMTTRRPTATKSSTKAWPTKATETLSSVPNAHSKIRFQTL